MAHVNTARGDIALGTFRLRPSFENLVAAEGEIGSLFALIDRAGAGQLTMQDMTSLLWHCLDPRPDGLTRSHFNAQLLAMGLAQVTPAFRAVLENLLSGA